MRLLLVTSILRWIHLHPEIEKKSYLETKRIAKSIAIEMGVATLFPQTAEAAAKVDVILDGDENVDVTSAAKAARVSLDGN
jgi:hypothetical protein